MKCVIIIFYGSQICKELNILFKLLEVMRIKYSRKELDCIRFSSFSCIRVHLHVIYVISPFIFHVFIP